MELRLAQVSDVAACGALDASYSADHAWQISEERPLRGGAHDLMLSLRLVELPRPRSVVPPSPAAELQAAWDTTDLWVVAEEDERLIAYLCATRTWTGASVDRLVVHQPYRRRGVASALLDAARGWAEEQHLRCLLAAAPTKNHPAIALLRARGYRICGYNERFYPSGEIAILLAQDVSLG